MKKISIIVTEFKNGAPVAQLSPNVDKVCTGHDLAALLAKIKLADSEAKVWRRNLVASRRALKER